MICLCTPTKIGVYLNVYPYKTMAQVKEETGCDIIFNGAMFNVSKVKPTQTFKANGELLSYEGIDYKGIAWNDKDVVLTNDHSKYDNFVSGLPLLVENGEIAPEIKGYPAEIGGKRGRTAIGKLKTGQIIARVTSDSDGACTIEELAETMKNMGCEWAINLDGGGSCEGIFPTGTITTKRTIYNYICLWTGNKGETDVFKIALGAGHGINTAGKRCLKSLDPNETREWWLNDRICDYVEVYLKDYEGYSLLRLDDSDDGADDVALATRTNAANAWGADFYLSVHHNAGVNGGSGGGICAFSYPGATKGAEWRDALYDALIAKTGLKGNRAEPTQTASFYVLKYTNMSAVLLELGFMDSSKDVPIILTEDFAQKCAKAIVETIAKRAGLKKKTVDEGKIYRVQLGAFTKRENAENLVKELKAKGYSSFIIGG